MELINQCDDADDGDSDDVDDNDDDDDESDGYRDIYILYKNNDDYI